MMNHLLSEKDRKAVLNILVEQLGVREDQLTLDAKLHEDLGGDSLSDVELVLALEERLNISLPDTEEKDVSTVQDVLELVAQVLNGKK